jgi:hypothetical protein
MKDFLNRLVLGRKRKLFLLLASKTDLEDDFRKVPEKSVDQLVDNLDYLNIYL